MGYNIGCMRTASSPSIVLAMVMSCILPSSLAFLTPSPVSSAIGSSSGLGGTQLGICPRVGSLVAAASTRQSQAGRVSLAPHQVVMQTATVAHEVEKVKKRTIVVAGATGRVGSAVVKQVGKKSSSRLPPFPHPLHIFNLRRLAACNSLACLSPAPTRFPLSCD